MALDYQNISDYRLYVSATLPASVTEDGFKGTSAPTYTEVKFVTGVSISDGGRTKDVTDLGSGGWMKSVREQLGLTLNITCEHVLDSDISGSDGDSLDPGQAILAAASEKIGLASRVSVQLRHPGAVEDEPLASAFPTAGKGTFFIATVQDGALGLGSGGSGGSFVTSSYGLVAYGKVIPVTFS